MLVISQITTKLPLGASWGYNPKGGISGRGGDSPLGNGDPVSICVKIQAHHHSNTGTSVSQPPSRHCFQVFLSNFFGVFWVPYMLFEDIESNGAADDFDSEPFWVGRLQNRRKQTKER